MTDQSSSSFGTTYATSRFDPVRSFFAITTESLTEGCCPSGEFDLSRLDAESPHLHLVIDAPDELDGAVGEVAGGVPRLVEPARPERR